ncbi:hypothetical protein Q5P01_000209 [Channa striata]|uniref:RING-type domain-containing protein n=1 Tax=Channa striata TaxID=64152 RepID=A0AA88LLY9_CHASR|nr:hypothetical protein Q5P01_000209 [Channa striata]
MMWEQTENVLDPCWKSPPSYNANNRISLWNVDSANDRGFSTEALETVKLMVDCFWTRVPGANFTIVDPETDFKLRTPHEPHNVTVLIPPRVGTAGMVRKICVRCSEPQTIYDLFAKYGLKCSDVWTCNTRTHVSCAAPCSVLVDNEMSMVRVTELPDDRALVDAVAEKARMYYGTRAPPRQLAVEATSNSLRREMYPLRDGHLELRSVKPQVTVINNTAPVKAVLCFENGMETLKRVLDSDGRFVPSVQATDRDIDHGNDIPFPWVSENTCIMEVPRNNNLLLQDSTKEPGDFVCLYCWANPNEVHLTCGHTCCKGCFSQLNNCGQCRTTITNRSNLKRKAPSETTFEVPAGFDFTCRTCKERKSWVSACGHVVCPCNVRCGVCSEAITEIRRIY